MSEVAVGHIWPSSTQVPNRAVRFAAVGFASTVLYWGLFLALVLSSTWATAAALVGSTLVNTSAQRRYTFNTGESGNAGRDHLMSLLAFGGSWLLTLCALSLLESYVPGAGALAQLTLAQACTLLGSAIRFTLLHAWYA